MDRFVRISRPTLSCLFVLSTLWAIWSARHWPLVGDASLIHYICFLMDHGLAPYRDLGDMNMPGAYLIEWTVMHTLGAGPLAWRVFDLLLMAAATAAFFAITVPYDWFAGVFASSLLILVHLRDGLAQAGQRDLTIAVCLLVSVAFLFRGTRTGRPWATALFGVFAGIAATVKPTVLPFGAVLLLLAVFTLRRRGERATAHVAWACAAFFIGPSIALIFLLKEHALGAFLHGLGGIVPYYASLGHRTLGYLLLHSISPLISLVIIWIVLLAVSRSPLSWERAALFLASAFGLVSYIVQARGFPYYRYPLLVFLLPLMAIDLTTALRPVPGRLAICVRSLAFAGLAVGALILAPVSAVLIHRYETHTDFITSLQQNLERLGGKTLSGHIQCIDSISGCGTTLYDMRLVQATGVLSDFLLFGPGDVPVVQETREQLRRALHSNPPQIIVISSALHIDGPGGYRKLANWPEFAQDLAAHYQLIEDWTPQRPDHWWGRPQWPSGYRIYRMKRLSSRCSPGDLSKTQIPFGNDKQKEATPQRK